MIETDQERVAVLGLIKVIHDNIEAPISARKAAEVIVGLANAQQCEFIAELSRIVRMQTAGEIAQRLRIAGFDEAAGIAERHPGGQA